MITALARVPPPALAALTSFLAAVLLTPAVIRVAHAWGLLARPRDDRWHKKPTALYGGVAIFLATALGGVLFLPWTPAHAGVLLGTTLVFLVGLVDDRFRIKPASKLLGQIAAACVAVLAGVTIRALPGAFLAVPVTILWIVGISNAFNLIDNMDGLSAGVAAISSFFILLFSWRQGNTEVATLAAVLGGAAAGFLIFNFNPARVFMGDCGSMTLGYVLACVSLLGTWREKANLFLILIAPALLLAVPIFDATLVTVLRTFAGRPVSQGGRDHSSHRLVALGLSERKAVVLLYGVCVGFGLVALAGLVYDLFAAAVGALLLAVGIFFFGVFLGSVPIYGAAAPPATESERPALLNTLLLHKRRFAEVAIDFVLVCAAYASAYLLRFEGSIPDAYEALIWKTLPLLIVIKMSAFFLAGVYRGVWKYVGIRDVINLMKATLAGSVATVIALLLAFRFDGLSRSVFVLDGLLLLFYASGARVLLRIFRELIGSGPTGGRRVLVVGAGDAGEMLLREMRNNPALGWAPVGLVDDDREKHGRAVHGVPVLGGRDDLADIALRTGAEEIVIAIPSAPGAAIAELARRCAATGLPYRTTRRLTELVDGRVSVESLRELDVLDFLQRRPIRIEDARVREAVAGRAIAVVGAGGTVGAALALRVMAFGPARLLLVDRDDNALARAGEAVPGAEVALADATQPGPLSALFLRFKPDLVVHAAGVNQLLLLEGSVTSAVRNNVLAVRTCLEAARTAGAGQFLLVSTIKAGNTRTVLGATRRLGEAVTAGAGPTGRVIRLGNVLGSRGGILARFREQALSGRPIALTDRESRRYVLAAEEAANAVLAAAAPGLSLEPGAVLFADHGEQARIADIAAAVQHWAATSGRPSVPLKVVGLRAGEALSDPELPSGAPEVVQGLRCFSPDPLLVGEGELGELAHAAESGDSTRTRRQLAAMVPGFGLAEADARVIELRRNR